MVSVDHFRQELLAQMGRAAKGGLNQFRGIVPVPWRQGPPQQPDFLVLRCYAGRNRTGGYGAYRTG